MAKLELALLVGEESKTFLANLTEVVERLEAVSSQKLAKTVDKEKDDEDDDFAPPAKKAAMVKAVKQFDDEDDDGEAGDGDTSDDEDDFTGKSSKKAKKLTLEDVNDACKKRAAEIGGKEGRTQVLTILKKKFKTQSVSELKPDQYAAVIASMS